nr:MAG TPA: hypothetical protein [Caudoviricetes sp.]
MKSNRQRRAKPLPELDRARKRSCITTRAEISAPRKRGNLLESYRQEPFSKTEEIVYTGPESTGR